MARRTRRMAWAGANCAHKTAGSVQPWNDAGGTHRVSAIFLAESLGHHLLLAAEAAEKQRAEPDKSRATGKPVREQQRLGDRPKPKSRVHRVPDVPVDAIRDESVGFPDFQAYG